MCRRPACPDVEDQYFHALGTSRSSAVIAIGRDLRGLTSLLQCLSATLRALQHASQFVEPIFALLRTDANSFDYCAKLWSI
jgi:hypothetical protein